MILPPQEFVKTDSNNVNAIVNGIGDGIGDADDLISKADKVIDAAENDEAETAGEGEGSRETKMSGIGLTELQKVAYEGIQEIAGYELTRKEINSKIQEVRERLEAKGISKKALAVALMVSKMNEDHLDGFDTAYLICRKAINLPVQSEMFDFPARST